MALSLVACASALAQPRTNTRRARDASTDVRDVPRDEGDDYNPPLDLDVPVVTLGDEGVTGDANDPDAPPDPLEQHPTIDDDRAAQRALGIDPAPAESDDERSGSIEGAALPTSPRIALEITSLSGRACVRALVRARVPFERVRYSMSGIATPVRILGAAGGVTWHASGDPGVHELMDCHLAVALVRFSAFLRSRGIREVRHLSIHRPATHAEVVRRPIQARHPGGLAIDAAIFVTDNGTTYNVQHDFRGRLGRAVCGPTARVPSAPAARFLRSLFCDAARRGHFQVLLSPNYNREHYNHFHLEVTRGVSWEFVR